MNIKTQNQITIGIVLPYLKTRGTEKQALGLTKGFVNEGARVVLFVVQGWGNQELYQAFTQIGVEVVNVGTANHAGEKKVRLLRLFSLSKQVKQYRCDVLLSRAGMTNEVTSLAGLFARIPTLAVISGGVKRQKIGKENRIMTKLITFRFKKNLGFPSHIITVSKEGRDNLIFNYPSLADSITAIPNGVDIEQILEMSKLPSTYTLSDEKFNICFAGSIEINRKGLDVLIEALNHVVHTLEHKDVRLTLIGTGDDMAKVKCLVNQHSLQKYVGFAGELNNPYGIIKQADVFVLPSRREGLPNALLEAMILGVCCIASDCDTGPREIIVDGKNGLLVPVGSSSALSNAIVRVKSDRELMKRLAENGTKTVASSFSYSTMIEGYLVRLKTLCSMQRR